MRRIFKGTKGTPRLLSHDVTAAATLIPLGKVNDTIQADLTTGKCTDFTGSPPVVPGGASWGRIDGSPAERDIWFFEWVQSEDGKGNNFATRLSSVFLIGKGNTPWVSLPGEKDLAPHC